MALRVNDPSMQADLAIIFETEHIKLTCFSLRSSNNIDTMMVAGGGSFHTVMGFSHHELQLGFEVLSSETRPINIVLGEFEAKITQFISKSGTSYNNRTMEIKGSRRELTYRFLINDLDRFNEELEKLAQKRLDKEFTVALEAELSKD